MLAERIAVLILFLVVGGAVITGSDTAFLLCWIVAIPLGAWMIFG